MPSLFFHINALNKLIFFSNKIFRISVGLIDSDFAASDRGEGGFGSTGSH